MLGVGTQDLAAAIPRLCARMRDAPSLRLVLLGDDGALLGSSTLPDGATVRVDGEDLILEGLDRGLSWMQRRVVLSSGDALRLLVIGQREDGLDAAATTIVELFEREALRDFEAEDTTEHLLSCFEQIRAMNDLADQLPDCSGLRDMSRLCLDSLLVALQARLGAVVIRDEAHETIEAVLLDAETQTIRREEVVADEIGDGPLAQTLADGTIRYAPAGDFADRTLSLERHARDALLIVPICFGSDGSSTVLGAIMIFDRCEGDSRRSGFGNPEAELTQSISVLLGLAIGTQLRASAEKELQIARAIQETLLPENAPAWKGLDLAGRNRSANQVGGDYFDFLDGVGGERHLVIADVSGHNMASAMAMVMARTQLRAMVAQEPGPARILNGVAGGLYGDLVRNELFITIFLLTVVERAEDRIKLRYTNAGHNPPLVLRGSGEMEWLDGGGPMVGFLPAPDYDECDVELAPGDLIVLFTDGVTEVMNPEGEMLDEEGLAEIVQQLRGGTARELLDGIFDAVDRHAGQPSDADDVTAVVIKFETESDEQVQR